MDLYLKMATKKEYNCSGKKEMQEFESEYGKLFYLK
jgi:hypothetical protein